MEDEYHVLYGFELKKGENEINIIKSKEFVEGINTKKFLKTKVIKN